MKKIIAIAITFVMAFVLVGCSKQPVLSFEKTDFTIEVGKEEALNPTVEKAEGEVVIEYAIADENIVSVVDGVIKALKAGSTTIEAGIKDYPKADKVTLNIVVTKIDVSNIVISGDNQVRRGETVQLNATVEPANASIKTIEWSSSDESVAAVSSEGVVTGVKVGNAKIIASVDGKQSEWNIEVIKPLVSKVTINGQNAMKVGEVQTLEAKLDPEDANQTVEWESSDESIATVSENGEVTALKAGEVEITAKAEGLEVFSSLTITITIPEVESIALSCEKTEISITEEIRIDATINPEHASNELVWESSDENIATVSKKGLVTPVGPGEVEISAIANNGIKGSITITISAPAVEKVTVTAEATEVRIDATTKVSASVLPEATLQKVTWSSSNEEIATVDQEGIVTPVSEGEVEIIATAYDGTQGKVVIAVKDFYKRVILVDAAYADGEAFVEDGIEYFVGINAFNNIKDAMEAVNEGGRILLAAGTYADNFTITKSLSILGPNANVDPNLSERSEEAVVTGVITLSDVNKVVINGIALTGSGKVKTTTTAQVSNITISNVYAYDVAAASTWTDSSKDYNQNYVINFVQDSNTTLSNKIIVKNCKFDVKEGAIKFARASNVTISGNSFNNFERDAVRFEGGYNDGTYVISDNKFENDQLQGYNGLYFSSYSGDEKSQDIYITGNTFKNIGNASATYTGAVSAKSYQENGAIWEVNDNTFENCVNYLKIRNNATAANHEAYPWAFTAKNNKFIGVPTGAYYMCKITSSDTDSTNPPKAIFDQNIFLDADGKTVITPDAAKLVSVASNTNNFESVLEYEMNKLGIEDEINLVVNGNWANEEAGAKVEFAGLEFVYKTSAFATLSEALAVATEGQGIYVFPGTYSETITISTNGLNIYGANPGINPNAENRNPESDFNESVITLASGLNGLKIQGLKFSGKSQINVKAGNISNVIIKNCLFNTSIGSGSNAVILGYGDGTSTEFNKDFQIINNRFDSETNSRILGFSSMENLLVEGNYFYTPATTYADFIKTEHAAGTLVVKNNEFNSCAQDALFLGNKSNNYTSVEIINNIFNAAGTMVDYGNAIDIRNGSYAGAVYTIQYNTFINIPADQNVLNMNSYKAATTFNINYNKFIGTAGKYLNADLANVTANLENNYFSDSEYASKVSGVSITNAYASEAEVEEYPYAPKLNMREITITSDPGSLYQLDKYQIEFAISPANATNKKVKFSVSDTKLATIDENGILTAIKPGIVTVYVTSESDSTIEASVDIEIKGQKRIDVELEGSTTLSKGETASLIATIVSGSSDDTIVWSSSDDKVLTVDESGTVTAVGPGSATIIGKLNTNEDILVDIQFTVVDSIAQLDEILQLFVEYNNSKVLYQDLHATGYQFEYDVVTYGSVSLYDFEKLVINESIQTPINDDNRPGTKKTSIEFVTVHNTDSSASTATAKAHASYVQDGGGGTSWGYSVGNDGIYYQLPDDEISFHAGDGKRVFKLEDSGVKATGDPLDAVITIDEEGYYEINGQSTKLRPYKWDSNTDTDSLDPGIYKTSDINDMGIFCTVGENGNYFLDKTYFNTTYDRIANYGGNRNSIGMETMVNQGSNLELTQHLTAKLCAHLCVKHNLPTSRIKGHHFFSGKNCPQTILENNLWDRFLSMCEAEYNILKNYSDYTITMVSNDPDILDNRGIIINPPLTTTTVSYTVTVTKGSDTKSITLSSIVEGSLKTPARDFTNLPG